MQAENVRRAGPGDFAMAGLMIVAAALRFHCLLITRDRPVGWDESEYLLKANNIAFGMPGTGFWIAHSIGVPLFAAGLFKIGLGQLTLRLIWIALSTADVALLYLIGRGLFGRTSGFIAAALLAFFPLDLSLSTLLLVDLPQLFFVMVAALLFVRVEFEGGDRRLTWLVLPVLLLGTIVRYSVAFFALTLLAYVMITRRTGLMKEKDWFLSGLFGSLIFVPFLIYSWLANGTPLAWLFARIYWVHRQPSLLTPFLEYATDVPHEISSIVLIAAAAGLVAAALSGTNLIDGDGRSPRRLLLLMLWIVVPWGCVGIFGGVFAPRLILMIYPALFLLIALSLDDLWRRLNSLNPALGAALVAMFICGLLSMLFQAEGMILRQRLKFESIRQAGLWIRAHSSPADAVISQSVPQITFYSERATYKYLDTDKDFLVYAQTHHARYMMLSKVKLSPAWTYDWPAHNPDKVKRIQDFALDSSWPATIFEFTPHAER